MFSGVLHSHPDVEMCTGPQEQVEKVIPVYLRNYLHIDVNQIEEACRPLELHNDQLKDIMNRMNERFENGLSDAPQHAAAIKMLPSYVRGLPDGTERGEYLALDLGGTNFRVLWVHLTEGEAEITSEVFRVPDYIMKGTGEDLFNHLAKCLSGFMDEHCLKTKEKLPLGFTFSFPCKQLSLNCAKLVNWTKGFKASGVENEDVVRLLKEACARLDLDIDVVAVINDTVGTLMAGAYKEQTCNIGVIAGTGSNACYMERIEKIEKIKDGVNTDDGHDEMCINIEWGAFGDDGALDFVRTKYDKLIDQHTINKGQQLFEKMVAGMYMGEITRTILEDLTRKGVLFGGDYEAISQPGIFPTKFISEIESEFQESQDGCQYMKTREIFEEIGISIITPTDCANVAYICSVVSRRAAHMVAAGIATLLRRINKPFVTVGVDGSVYRFHPTFAKLLDAKIDELLDGKFKYHIMLADDGSGKGAALVAAVATRMAHEQENRIH